MVCLGNICRSPMAHGILDHLAKQNGLDWYVDSCGTGGYHNGEPPHPNSTKVSNDYGIDITKQISRQITRDDLEEFDLILAMDTANFRDVKLMMTEEQQSKLQMILNYAYPGENRQVPDPWYNHSLYEDVFLMIREACEAIIKRYSKS